MNILINEAKKITFVMVDTDGTEVAGLGTGFTLQISKNAGAFGASAGTKAEIGSGWYSYVFTATETNTLGPLAIKITGAGAVQQNILHEIVSAATLDPLQNAVPGSYLAGTAGYALGRIVSASITVVSPMATSGNITTYAGAGYLTEDGMDLTWTDSEDAWPSSLGVTDTVTVRVNGLQLAATLVTGGTHLQVVCQPAGAETLAIAVGEHTYQVVATQTDFDIYPPLVEGTWINRQILTGTALT